jgi:hypothetical protein
MAGRGTPAAPGSRRYRDAAAAVSILVDGKRRGPALPTYSPFVDSAGKRIPWHPQTRRWWNNWRTSPQAVRMLTDPDWDTLLDAAVLHHRFWNGELGLAGELRLRVAKFGATPEDRARLRVEVGTPPVSNEQSPAPTTERSNVSSLAEQRWARVLAEEPLENG